MRLIVPAAIVLVAHTVLSTATLPRFDRELLLEQSAETSANVSVGDLNGDKVPDLVLAKGRHWPLIDRVLINDGHGRFTAHNLGEVADRSYSVTLTDIDRDGDLDVVVGNDEPDPKRIYANDGRGHFQQLSTFGRPEWPTRLATVADLNGDGLPDIVVANRTGSRNPGSNYVCLNRGKGHFDADCLAFSHESATTITPADVNRDGFVDLIVPHRDGGQSFVYLNDGSAGFAKRIPFGRADAEIRSAEVVDLNADKIPDLVAIDERRGPFVSFGQPDLTFSEPVSFGVAKTTPYALATGDVDLDGRVDVIVGHVEAPPVVFFNDGTGRHLTPVRFGNNQGTAYGFAIGDLDGDGLPDIAVARSDAPNAVYFAVRR
jgi:FG-GAP-like repeat